MGLGEALLAFRLTGKNTFDFGDDLLQVTKEVTTGGLSIRQLASFTPMFGRVHERRVPLYMLSAHSEIESSFEG